MRSQAIIQLSAIIIVGVFIHELVIILRILYRIFPFRFHSAYRGLYLIFCLYLCNTIYNVNEKKKFSCQ